MIEVRPVDDRPQLGRFIGFPYALYRGHPHWVPPLRLSEWEQFDPSRNPFWSTADRQLFLALEGGRVVGRIAAIDDHRHNEVRGENLAAFGFLEAVTGEAASALLACVERWARERGRTAVRGPLNPSLNHSGGLQVDGFDTDPCLMMPCNPPEYASYIEAAGYAKVQDLYAWLADLRQPLPLRIQRLAEQSARRGRIVVRPMDFRIFTSEMEKVRAVYSSAWQRNWGFVAPTPEEFRHIATDLKRIAAPDGVLLAEAGGVPVGCAVCLPDINQVLKGTAGRLFPLGLARFLARRWIISRMRLLLCGVTSQYRNTDVLVLLVHRIHQFASRAGYRSAELSWTLEHNVAVNRILEQGLARRYKTYRLYQKMLR